jgi:hypothetical protein
MKLLNTHNGPVEGTSSYVRHIRRVKLKNRQKSWNARVRLLSDISLMLCLMLRNELHFSSNALELPCFLYSCREFCVSRKNFCTQEHTSSFQDVLMFHLCALSLHDARLLAEIANTGM